MKPFTTGRSGQSDSDRRPALPQPRPDSVASIGFHVVIETTLTALTKAWVTTVIASTLFCAALAIAQIWNGAAYFGALPQALSLAGETPDPSVELWTGAALKRELDVSRYAARAGHTGS